MTRQTKEAKKKSSNAYIIFRPRPIDRQLIAFLQGTSTLPVSSVIREALAYRAESKGMNLSKLMEQHGSTTA